MDEQLLLWINQGWAHPVLDGLFWWVSQRLWFAAPLAAILFYHSIRRYGPGSGVQWLLLLATTVAIGDMLGGLLKELFAAPRPCQILFEQLRGLGGALAGPCGSDPNGMPSNHAINFLATATFVVLTTSWRGWQIGLFVVALLVSISRIYLGKHYPSQVLAGAAIGALVGGLGAWLAMRYRVAASTPPAQQAAPHDSPDFDRDHHDSS